MSSPEMKAGSVPARAPHGRLRSRDGGRQICSRGPSITGVTAGASRGSFRVPNPGEAGPRRHSWCNRQQGCGHGSSSLPSSRSLDISGSGASGARAGDRRCAAIACRAPPRLTGRDRAGGRDGFPGLALARAVGDAPARSHTPTIYRRAGALAAKARGVPRQRRCWANRRPDASIASGISTDLFLSMRRNRRQCIA